MRSLEFGNVNNEKHFQSGVALGRFFSQTSTPQSKFALNCNVNDVKKLQEKSVNQFVAQSEPKRATKLYFWN